MNRKERRELEKKNKKLQKLKNKPSNFERLLEDKCLSAIGNRDPFVIYFILTDGTLNLEDFMESDLNGVFYRQDSVGKIGHVVSSKGDDVTEDFNWLQSECETILVPNTSQAIKNFEMIKVINFGLEKRIREPFIHVIFTDRSEEAVLNDTEELARHYKSHYGFEKPLRVEIYAKEESTNKVTFH